MLDAICSWITHLLERLFLAALLWLHGGPDKPWNKED